jgi:phosphosulfolactate synthase (CoM biosynthesis protein A)
MIFSLTTSASYYDKDNQDHYVEELKNLGFDFEEKEILISINIF